MFTDKFKNTIHFILWGIQRQTYFALTIMKLNNREYKAIHLLNKMLGTKHCIYIK